MVYFNYIKYVTKIAAILLIVMLGCETQKLSAQCLPMDSVCVADIDSLFLNADTSYTAVVWYTDNGATITPQPGDTMVFVDWSTSSIIDGIDEIFVDITTSCGRDTFSMEVYLEDCVPDCNPVTAADTLAFCTYILANPTSAIALDDCDSGGIDNLTECQNGDDPFNAADDASCNSPAIVLTRVGAPTICDILAANPTDPIGTQDCDGGGIDNLTECQNSLDPENPGDDCIVPVGAQIGVYSLAIQNGENETPVLPIVTYLEKDPNGTSDASTWVFSGSANFAHTSGVQGQGQTNFTDGAFHYNVLNGSMSHGYTFEIQSAHFFSGGNGNLTDKEGSQLTRIKSATGGAATACRQCPTDLTLNVAAKGAALAGISITGTSFYYTIDGGTPIPITTFVPPSVNEVPQDILFTCPGVGICQDIEFIQESTYEYTGGTAVNPSPVITYQKVELCWGK